MKIFFRFDYNEIIGSGHLFRCLTIIKGLKKNNEIFIISRANSTEKKLIEQKLKKEVKKIFFFKPENKIKKKNYRSWLRTSQIKDSVETSNILKKCKAGNNDVIIVDHYGIHNIWIKQINKKIGTIFIDDFIRKNLKSDIIINGNVNAKKNFYIKRRNQKIFVGSKFAIINPMYNPKFKLSSVKKILVFFSNSDLNKFYLKIIKSLKEIKDNLQITVIGGLSNKVNNKLTTKKIRFFNYVKNFDKMILKSTLCIGSCGSAYLQRLYYNIPSIVYSLSENQKPFCNFLDKNKAALYLGNEQDFSSSNFKKKFYKIINDKKKLMSMSTKSKIMVDKFTLQRVLEIIKPSDKNKLKLKRAKINDINIFYNWVKDNKVVKNSVKRKKITYENHKKWFKKAISNPKIKIFVLYLNNIPVGQIRFNKRNKKYILDYSLDWFVRGRYFGQELVKMGMNKLEKKERYIIEAKVRKNNLQSKKIFENLNFKYKLKNEFIIFKYV